MRRERGKKTRNAKTWGELGRKFKCDPRTVTRNHYALGGGSLIVAYGDLVDSFEKHRLREKLKEAFHKMCCYSHQPDGTVRIVARPVTRKRFHIDYVLSSDKYFYLMGSKESIHVDGDLRNAGDVIVDMLHDVLFTAVGERATMRVSRIREAIYTLTYYLTHSLLLMLHPAHSNYFLFNLRFYKATGSMFRHVFSHPITGKPVVVGERAVLRVFETLIDAKLIYVRRGFRNSKTGKSYLTLIHPTVILANVLKDILTKRTSAREQLLDIFLYNSFFSRSRNPFLARIKKEKKSRRSRTNSNNNGMYKMAVHKREQLTIPITGLRINELLLNQFWELMQKVNNSLNKHTVILPVDDIVTASPIVQHVRKKTKGKPELLKTLCKALPSETVPGFFQFDEKSDKRAVCSLVRKARSELWPLTSRYWYYVPAPLHLTPDGHAVKEPDVTYDVRFNKSNQAYYSGLFGNVIVPDEKGKKVHSGYMVYKGFSYSRIFRAWMTYELFRRCYIHRDKTCKGTKVFVVTSRGGRMYDLGGIQHLNSELRRRIIVDGEPVVEVDFASMMPVLFYVTTTQGVTQDKLAKFNPYGPYKGLLRLLVKKALMCLVNSKTPKAAVHALVKFLIDEGFGKRPITYKGKKCSLFDLAKIMLRLAYYLNRNTLRRAFFSDYGQKAQRIESDIALGVMGAFALLDKFCMSVHDAFLVKRSDYKLCIYIMLRSFNKHLERKGVRLNAARRFSMDHMLFPYVTCTYRNGDKIVYNSLDVVKDLYKQGEAVANNLLSKMPWSVKREFEKLISGKPWFDYDRDEMLELAKQKRKQRRKQRLKIKG